MYLEEILHDQKSFRKKQFLKACFSELIDSVDEITVFPKSLRENLKSKKLQSFKVLLHKKTEDTEKILIELEDSKKVEAVLMKHKGRRTVCVSSQVGCAANCSFCATGKMGFSRNLSHKEIVDQVLYFSRSLKKEWKKLNPNEKWSITKVSPEFRVRNIVFMGMGEPLHNFDNVSKAIDIFSSDDCMGLSMRHITISTVGIAKNIKQLLEFDKPPNLAVSLHAATDELRNKIVPTNMGFPLEELFKALDAYTEKTKNRIFYEWTVLRGENDTEEQMVALGELLKNRNAHVNFIPWNPCSSREKHKKPSMDHIKKMQNFLDNKYGVKSTIRAIYGQDIDGACGQLTVGQDNQ